MSLNIAPVTVDTSADLLATGQGTGMDVIVQNLGAEDLFVGHSAAVTISTGLKVEAGKDYSVFLRAGDTLYGIVGSSTADVRVQKSY